MPAVRAHPTRSRTPAAVMSLVMVGTLVGATLSSPRLQAEGLPTVQVELVAPSTCGGPMALEQRIRARLRPSSLATNGAWKARVEIVLHDSAPLVTGSLQLDAPAPGEGRLVREVGGGDCSEVLDALALITALAIDGGVVLPSISSIPLPPSSSSVRSATSSTPSSSGSTLSSAPSIASAQAASPSVSSASPSPAVSSRATDTGVRRWRWNVGIQGGVMGVIAPTLGPEGGIFVEGLWPSSLGGLLRFTVQQARPATVHTRDGDARFVATTLRALGCPARWPRDAMVTLAPCAGFELGLLDAKGSNAPDAKSVTTVWLTGQIAGRVGVDLSRLVALVLDAGAIVPTRHDRFYFDPSGVTAHRPPAIGPWLSLGFAARLP